MNVLAEDTEEKLQRHIEGFVYDPLGFVYYAYPWGSGLLKGETGPDEWQTEILKLIGEGSLSMEEAVMIAVRSGHGVGKTGLISWIIDWFISTRPHPQIVVTANTKPQLEGKTWRELNKWHNMLINKHWFEWTATKYYLKDHPGTWFAAAQPWSKERSEAFAGTHEKHVLIIFDEASAIEDIIWEVTEGAMTTPGAIWIVFGNPTRNTGRFSDCFKKYRHRWITREIDSRTAKMADKKQIAKWIDDYGEDSDFVRVRVKGQEPRSGTSQFIGNDIVQEAQGRVIHPTSYLHAPKIIGVDCARYGQDRSVIAKRQGLAVFDLIKFRDINAMHLGDKVVEEADSWGADGIIIDMGNIGAAIFDYLVHKLNRKDVIGVWFGSNATRDDVYFNKRAEMWGDMKDWLKAGGCIPDDNELRDDLTAPEYGYDAKDRTQLQKKEDMDVSPDCADALAVTFAAKIQIAKVLDSRENVAEEWSPHEY